MGEEPKVYRGEDLGGHTTVASCSLFVPNVCQFSLSR